MKVVEFIRVVNKDKRKFRLIMWEEFSVSSLSVFSRGPKYTHDEVEEGTNTWDL